MTTVPEAEAPARPKTAPALGPRRLKLQEYALVAVVLPLVGLVWVAGMDYWSSVWPEKWSPVENVRAAVEDDVIRRAILTSVVLGIVTGAALVASYPRSPAQR